MDQQQQQVGHESGYMYALGGKIMLSAIFVLFVVVVFISAFHLYAKWYFLRTRRHRRGGGTVALHVDNHQSANRGLEREVLNSLPTYVHCSTTAEPSSPVECAVCLAEFEDKEVVRLLPKCAHSFHIECINTWFYSHSTCPLCRSPVESAAGQSDQSVVVLQLAEDIGSSGPAPISDSEPRTQKEEGNHCSCSDKTASVGGRKDIGGETIRLTIEVAPRTARGAGLESEQSQSSPGPQLSYFKRLLSMNLRSPAGSCGLPSPIAGTSGCAAVNEVDLEIGIRVQTPRS